MYCTSKAHIHEFRQVYVQKCVLANTTLKFYLQSTYVQTVYYIVTCTFFFFLYQQVQKSVDNQFKKAIEKYRDDADLQNAIDAVQEGVSTCTCI